MWLQLTRCVCGLRIQQNSGIDKVYSRIYQYICMALFIGGK